MEFKPLTMWEQMKLQGYSRRDFLQMCGWLAAASGIEFSSLGKVVHAMETKPRPPVVWYHFQECTCCSESFIRSSHPLVANIVLDRISLDYTETLQAAAGHQAEEALHNTLTKYKGQYLMVVEGSVPTAANGAYCCIAGRSAMQIVQEGAKDAAAIIAWGSCASNGCVQSANPNPTSATPLYQILDGKQVMNVPGCPPIGEVMAGTIVQLLTFGHLPELTDTGRPKAFYSRRIHDTCYRRPNFDAGLFAESFDDENARRGYCLYKLGCRGPVTYNACAVTKWNEGTSFPIQSGHPCIGCSEAGFWDNTPFYRQLPSFPGFGIEATADKVGAIAAAATAVGVGVHAVASGLRSSKARQQQGEADKGGE